MKIIQRVAESVCVSAPLNRQRFVFCHFLCLKSSKMCGGVLSTSLLMDLTQLVK